MAATAEAHERDVVADPAEPPMKAGFAVIAQRPDLGAEAERPRRQRVRSAVETRALAIWPRIDPRVLSRCQGEAACLARAIARRRTTLSEEHVIRILNGADG